MNQKKAINSTKNWMKDLWVYCLRPFIIVAATLLILYVGVSKVVTHIVEHYVLPPQPDNEESFILEIPSGYGVRGISRILEENEIISNSFVFRLYVDFSNNSYKLQSGRYIFRHNMTMQEVMDQLLIGNNTVPTTNITILEGWTIGRIATYLTTTKQLEGFTEEEFIEYAIPSNFPEYWFLDEIPEDRLQYGYSLQGYLFPDTYTIYTNATPDEIIRKMLDNFSVRVTQEMIESASAKGYTLDELITFASVLEKEAANVEEYGRCAAVVKNRLDANMTLQMDSTLVYMLALKGESRASSFELTTADINTPSPYNTYLNRGLPIGPISNPGLAAIKAALSPNEKDIKEKTLYFTLNPDTGTHTFNSDYSKHVYYSNLYAQRWKELQEQAGK